MPEFRYDVVLEDRIAEGHNLEQVKLSAARLFNIESDRVNYLFRHLPVVIKRSVDRPLAEKYFDVLSREGLCIRLKERPVAPPKRSVILESIADITASNLPQTVDDQLTGCNLVNDMASYS